MCVTDKEGITNLNVEVKLLRVVCKYFSWAKYDKISVVAISANSLKKTYKLIIWISQTATILKIN
jgi:hypothetical protein